MSRSAKAFAVTGLAAAIVVGGGLASASIPSAGGTIQGCYKGKNVLNSALNTNGNLRVIDPSAGEACTNSETPISWNQAGQQGPVGPQGPEGPQGPKGDAASRLFAVVNSDGTVVASSGVVTDPTVTRRTGTGLYVVGFNQDITHCAQAITVRQSTVGVIKPLFAKGGRNGITSVNVVVFGLDGAPYDQSFDVTLTC